MTSSCRGRAAAVADNSGASSSTTWAFVPPIPKELTPARREAPSDAHGDLSALATKGVRARSSFGLGLVKLTSGGIVRCFRANTVFIKLATPAAASR